MKLFRVLVSLLMVLLCGTGIVFSQQQGVVILCVILGGFSAFAMYHYLDHLTKE